MRADNVATVSLSRTGTQRLHDDRTRIELAGDEVHGRAGDLHAVLERLLLGIDAGERRQQRRMDVEHGVRKGVEQPRADQTHETGEADEADAARSRSSCASRRSKSSRVANARWLMTSVSMPASRARSRPPASARFEMTTAMRASSSPRAIAPISA